MSSLGSPAGVFGYAYAGVAPDMPVAASLLSLLALPGGASITNAYDNCARLLFTKLFAADSALVNAHAYVYNVAGQRTRQTFTMGNYVDYTYDNIGQLKTASGKEPGSGASRLSEQLGYNPSDPTIRIDPFYNNISLLTAPTTEARVLIGADIYRISNTGAQTSAEVTFGNAVRMFFGPPTPILFH